MRTLYFDCFAGASGNMVLGALVSLGLDENELANRLKGLKNINFNIEFSKVDRSGISAVHANVIYPHEHVHRHLVDIEKIINDSDLSEKVKLRSISIFKRLAEAEAKIHGIEIEKVHFHEVGAVDAIVDIVGACLGFEMLEIERFSCSKIHVGSGFVKMAHGNFPVPPPAVAELLKEAPIYSTEISGELITPTGAAIISTLCDSYGSIPDMMAEQIGYGAGTREYENFPNVLRLMVGEQNQKSVRNAHENGKHNGNKSLLDTSQLTLIESNIDDVSPQILGFVMECAFELGALDCWFTPIQMKKNRAATMISILCEEKNRVQLTELLYSETTTLGVRLRQVERECLPREIVTVQTKWGKVDIKIARLHGKVINSMPEYDQVRLLALENNVAFKVVRDAALAELS